jgi:hypothetical protein
MHRRTVIIASAFSAILLCICLWSGLFSAAWKRATFQYRVQVGMSLDEVEAILGPGQLEWGVDGNPRIGGDEVQGDVGYRWYANGFEFYVGFRDGKVCDKVAWFIDYP